MREEIKNGYDIQVDDEGQEWINGTQITQWDVNGVPRNGSLFIKGVSGNPSGAPKLNQQDRINVMRKCLKFSSEGVDILIGFARDTKLKPPVRIKAIEVIFDRGLGRVPEQKEDTMTTEDLISALPSVFFPDGKKPDAE